MVRKCKLHLQYTTHSHLEANGESFEITYLVTLKSCPLPTTPILTVLGKPDSPLCFYKFIFNSHRITFFS